VITISTLNIDMQEQIDVLVKNMNHSHLAPVIIEITGSPNAGKTYAINALERYLKKYNLKIKYITESATRCHIKNKLSIQYNLWTAAEMIKQLLSAIDKNYTLIVCERGVFDAICWADFHLKQNNITKNQFDILSSYYSYDFWSNRINLIYIMTCNPNVTIDREQTVPLNNTRKSIINYNTLKCLNNSFQDVATLFYARFSSQREMDTSNLSKYSTGRAFISDIMEYLLALYR
jgi:hypothetical protein